MPCVAIRRRLVMGRANNHDQGTREPAIQRIQGLKFALLSTFKRVCQGWDRGCQVRLNRIGRGQYRPVRTGHADGRALGPARRALRASFDEGDGLPHVDGQAHVGQHTCLLLPRPYKFYSDFCNASRNSSNMTIVRPESRGCLCLSPAKFRRARPLLWLARRRTQIPALQQTLRGRQGAQRPIGCGDYSGSRRLDYSAHREGVKNLEWPLFGAPERQELRASIRRGRPPRGRASALTPCARRS